LQPAIAEYGAAHVPVSKPLVRAKRRFLAGRKQSARCIPALPLPIYNGSGCLNPLRSPTHNYFSNAWAAFSIALPVPGHAWLNAILRPARSGQVAFTPPAHHAFVTGHSVTPFVCALRPAPPVARTRRFNCLAEATPSLRFSCQRRLGPGCAWSYLEHSHQSAAFKAPANNAGTGYHSGSHTSCAVILVLHHSSHVGWTRPSMLTRYVRSSRSAIVSGALEAPISGERIQKRPLTRSGRDFTHSAPSLLSFTGKGLMPLSSLSFSRSAFLAEPRRLSASGRSVLPPPGSRRQRALPEPHEPCTRLAIVALVLSPAGGLGGPWSSAPALNKTDLAHCSVRRVPLALSPFDGSME
jgi:hypothetical protein